MPNTELSGSPGSGMITHLDRLPVLQGVVAQLCKDLATGEIAEPEPGEGAFEALRADVLKVLTQRQRESVHALQVVLYRVDVPERPAREAMQHGGLPELARLVTLRALQKVIVRLHFNTGH